MNNIIDNNNLDINILANNIAPFENNILLIDKQYSLPVENVLVNIDERRKVLKNIDEIILKIPIEKRERSLYLSKFISAVVSGLFDAALNYLWDETIGYLRTKISQIDINYFYDLVILDEKERKKYSNESDLVKVSDNLLINGALKLEILDEFSYKMIDNIRFMRNFASAAHPNQNELKGLQLVSYFEICVEKVLLKDFVPTTLSVNRLLNNIKKSKIEKDDATLIANSFNDLPKDKLEDLCNGFFGIFCRNNQDEYVYNNILNLLPYLWVNIDEDFKYLICGKIYNYIINGDEFVKSQAKNFIKCVKGEKYLPEDVRSNQLQLYLNKLILVHNSVDNFRNEVIYASSIDELIKNNIPNGVEKFLVETITMVFLTNGYGVSWVAEPIYKRIIKSFNDKQIKISICSINNIECKNKLDRKLCKEKLLELLKIYSEICFDNNLKGKILMILNYDIVNLTSFNILKLINS